MENLDKSKLPPKLLEQLKGGRAKKSRKRKSKELRTDKMFATLDAVDSLGGVAEFDDTLIYMYKKDQEVTTRIKVLGRLNYLMEKGWVISPKPRSGVYAITKAGIEALAKERKRRGVDSEDKLEPTFEKIREEIEALSKAEPEIQEGGHPSPKVSDGESSEGLVDEADDKQELEDPYTWAERTAQQIEYQRWTDPRPFLDLLDKYFLPVEVMDLEMPAGQAYQLLDGDGFKQCFTIFDTLQNRPWTAANELLTSLCWNSPAMDEKIIERRIDMIKDIMKKEGLL